MERRQKVRIVQESTFEDGLRLPEELTSLIHEGYEVVSVVSWRADHTYVVVVWEDVPEDNQ